MGNKFVLTENVQNQIHVSEYSIPDCQDLCDSAGVAICLQLDNSELRGMNLVDCLAPEVIQKIKKAEGREM